MAFLSKTFTTKKGFTLIELLIVVAIMGILFAAIAFIATEMIRRARVARAQGDTSNLAKAVLQLTADTGQFPKHFDAPSCYTTGAASNHIELDRTALVGLSETDGLFPGWKGPYVENVPIDPWGNKYVLDQDYECNISNKGCEEYAAYANVAGDFDAVAIFSRGQNESDFTTYDEDNIVTVLCGEEQTGP